MNEPKYPSAATALKVLAGLGFFVAVGLGLMLGEKWGPVLRAQRESTKVINESAERIARMGIQLEELRFARIRRTAGAPAELRARAAASDLEARGSEDLANNYRRLITEAGSNNRRLEMALRGMQEASAAQQRAQETAARQRADAALADQLQTFREDAH